MICPYCQTNQKEKTCSFCGADLEKERPQIKQVLTEDEAYQPQPMLQLYHTYDLMRLLKYARHERSKAYKNMQDVRNAPERVKIPQSTIDYAREEYDTQTARMRVLEGIIIDRLGYKPQRIDDKLLSKLYQKSMMNKGDTQNERIHH